MPLPERDNLNFFILMDNREFLPGAVYISDFNDREYTFNGVKKGFAWVVGADGVERPLSIAVFTAKYHLKHESPKKKKRNVAA